MTLSSRLAACVLALCIATPLYAQQRPTTQQQIPGLPDASEPGDRKPGDTGDRNLEDIMRDNQRKLNKKRQQDLKRDTDKLLDLATELKKYVDKSNENVLSLEVLRKAEEIEKLARSVKDKMKGQ